MAGHRLFRKNRQGEQEGDIVLNVNEQLEHKELCLGMDEELAEN